ncbi:MAG: polysaccharide lyase 6 family protein [Planctomycetota bacterium]
MTILTFPQMGSGCILAILANLVLLCSPGLAELHYVSNADEIETLLESKGLVAGDEIVWKDGVVVDQEVNLAGVDGTAQSPITLRAETPGQVILHGESQFRIGVKHWIVQGFHFTGKPGLVNAYNPIQFRNNGGLAAEHCRLTDCALTNLITDESTSKWVLLYGRQNTIDHCHFSGKNSKGALLTVELGYLDTNSTAEHKIHSNYFGGFQPQPGNDNETIRIGFSGDQNKSAKCIVNRNLFERCDGESEVISNKSSYNTFRSNTFRQCNGALVLRHGHHARVEGNFFLGANAEGTGGIRISDSHHVIVNNQLQDLQGSNWNAAVSILGDSKPSGGSSSGYQAVNDIVLMHNTVVNCRQCMFMNPAKGNRAPTGIVANNIFSTRLGPLVSGKLPTTGLDWQTNIWDGEGVPASVGQSVSFEMKLIGELYRPNRMRLAELESVELKDSPVVDMDGQARPKTGKAIGADEIAVDDSKIGARPLTIRDVGVSYQSLLPSAGP